MEQKEIDIRRRETGMGVQYLQALLKCAEWVPKEYKMLADRNKNHIEILKELYLCACDGVPIEKAIVAMEKKPEEGALRFVRQKHIENIAMGDYKEELSGIKEKTNEMEREVMQMSKMLQYIVRREPDFDSMFPDKAQKIIQPKQNESIESEVKPEKLDVQDVESQTKKDSINIIKEEMQQPDVKRVKEENVPKFSTIKNLVKLELPWHKKQSVTVFVGKLLEQGYSSEQVDFLLKCIEAGTDIKMVKKIASPKLPINVMRRLLKMEERGEKANGK